MRKEKAFAVSPVPEVAAMIEDLPRKEVLATIDNYVE
jgi:hypothetical protein